MSTRTTLPVAPPSKTPVLDSLKEKEQRFVINYHSTGNATRSAMRAYGQTYFASATTGKRLLKKAKIRLALAELRHDSEERAQVSLNDILLKLKATIFSTAADLFSLDAQGNEVLRPVGEMDVDTQASIASIEVERVIQGGSGANRRAAKVTKIKFEDRFVAIRELSKRLGWDDPDMTLLRAFQEAFGKENGETFWNMVLALRKGEKPVVPALPAPMPQQACAEAESATAFLSATNPPNCPVE